MKYQISPNVWYRTDGGTTTVYNAETRKIYCQGTLLGHILTIAKNGASLDDMLDRLRRQHPASTETVPSARNKLSQIVDKLLAADILMEVR